MPSLCTMVLQRIKRYLFYWNIGTISRIIESYLVYAPRNYKQEYLLLKHRYNILKHWIILSKPTMELWRIKRYLFYWNTHILLLFNHESKLILYGLIKVDFIFNSIDETETFFQNNKSFIWAGALVLWLWAETHVPKVMSSNPSTTYWMDIFSNTNLL